MNSITLNRIPFSGLRSIRTSDDFSDYLIHIAIEKYVLHQRAAGLPLGSVMAICATEREAMNLIRYPFDAIVLTGIHDREKAMKPFMEMDERLSYQRQNGEALSFSSRSFDLVFCKSGLHHFARPVLGVYEMLRTSRKEVLFIEPYETMLSPLLDYLNLRSVYERDESMNISSRDNYVYRWDKRQLNQLLNSYYLDSGYHLDLTVGWMSNRVNASKSVGIRLLGSTFGWLLNFLPGCAGNQVICSIVPGKDLPPDPRLVVK